SGKRSRKRLLPLVCLLLKISIPLSFSDTKMSANYWTDNRQRLCRLQAAFIRMNDIVRDLADICFSTKHGHAYPSLADHWQQWSYDNHAYIKKYRFWKKQAKEKYLDQEIPILDSADVTFLVYLMAEIDPDCAAIKMFQEIRNLVAHMTETELDEDTFRDRFQKIIEAVDVGFKSNLETHQKWRAILESIRTDKISGVEELQSQFQSQSATVRWEVSQTNNNFGINGINDCNNVQIYNITVIGDATPGFDNAAVEWKSFHF
ncbi:MAG: hypothetical protein VX367_11405, partial [SAR324 cluster bacterium]|nr:hypothetical protein [SAR324 cluster bacterium]